MKKYLFLFAVCVSLALSSGQAYAQRYLPGMKGVELRGGFAGNLKSPVDWYTGFAVSGYTKRANHWVAGVEYLLKNYGYRGTSVPRAQFTAEGGYYLKFLSDPAKIFFLSVGGSALVGYETLNWGEKVLYDGSMLSYRDAFVYGGALTLELESYVTDRIVLLAHVRERVLWGSSLGKFTTQFGVGVRFIIYKTPMDIEMIRGIPIEEFLSRLGHEPVRRHGDECWYLSPCREERTPSFHVNTRKGVWHDFGTGHGGDIFTLAGELSGSDGFMAQARFIAGVYGGTIPEYVGHKREKESVRTEKRKEPSRFEEVVCGPLRCNALLGYLKGRGIPAEIARAECEEIRFRLYGKRYFAVGFRNMGGGYELRTRFMNCRLPTKDISLIRNGSLTCNLFEGFIDFLSWKVLGISRGEDYLVLNSVSLLERSFPYLDNYGKIRCYLDNDDAGRRTLAVLRKRYGDRIDDCSDLYAGCKDLNEYLESNFPPEQ